MFIPLPSHFPLLIHSSFSPPPSPPIFIILRLFLSSSPSSSFFVLPFNFVHYVILSVLFLVFVFLHFLGPHWSVFLSLLNFLLSLFTCFSSPTPLSVSIPFSSTPVFISSGFVFVHFTSSFFYTLFFFLFLPTKFSSPFLPSVWFKLVVWLHLFPFISVPSFLFFYFHSLHRFFLLLLFSFSLFLPNFSLPSFVRLVVWLHLFPYISVI